MATSGLDHLFTKLMNFSRQDGYTDNANGSTLRDIVPHIIILP